MSLSPTNPPHNSNSSNVVVAQSSPSKIKRAQANLIIMALTEIFKSTFNRKKGELVGVDEDRKE